jgi:microcystin-dependent protein
MSDSPSYVGEIRMFAGKFAPDGWVFCEGQLLSIEEFDVLFALIGTSYGGDGQSNFALPDLRARIPIHQGNGFGVGQDGGVEQVTLTDRTMPEHGHAWLGSGDPATASTPLNNMPAEASKRFYVSPSTVVAMALEAMGPSGGGQPHGNHQPFLCVNFFISLFGIFPSPT